MRRSHLGLHHGPREETASANHVLSEKLGQDVLDVGGVNLVDETVDGLFQRVPGHALILRACLVSLLGHHLRQLERRDVRATRLARGERFSLFRRTICTTDPPSKVPPAIAPIPMPAVVAPAPVSDIATARSRIPAPGALAPLPFLATGRARLTVAAASSLGISTVAPLFAVASRRPLAALRRFTPAIAVGRRCARRAGA